MYLSIIIYFSIYTSFLQEMFYQPKSLYSHTTKQIKDTYIYNVIFIVTEGKSCNLTMTLLKDVSQTSSYPWNRFCNQIYNRITIPPKHTVSQIVNKLVSLIN